MGRVKLSPEEEKTLRGEGLLEIFYTNEKYIQKIIDAIQNEMLSHKRIFRALEKIEQKLLKKLLKDAISKKQI